MHSISQPSKLLVVTLGVLGVLATTSRAEAQEGGRPFGLGIMLGSPTGLSGKLYLGGKPFALQAGLGFVDDDADFGDDDDDGLHIFVDVVWHPAVLARADAFTLPLYVGVGGRILDDDDRCGNGCRDDDTYVGVRVPVGILFDFNRVPLDLFFELSLTVDLIEFDDDDFDDDNHDRSHLNGAIGGRYYF